MVLLVHTRRRDGGCRARATDGLWRETQREPEAQQGGGGLHNGGGVVYLVPVPWYRYQWYGTSITRYIPGTWRGVAVGTWVQLYEYIYSYTMEHGNPGWYIPGILVYGVHYSRAIYTVYKLIYEYTSTRMYIYSYNYYITYMYSHGWHCHGTSTAVWLLQSFNYIL